MTKGGVERQPCPHCGQMLPKGEAVCWVCQRPTTQPRLKAAAQAEGKAGSAGEVADERWYYERSGEVHGPVARGELARLARLGVILASDRCRREGTSEWITASHVPALLPLVPSPPPAALTRPAKAYHQERRAMEGEVLPRGAGVYLLCPGCGSANVSTWGGPGELTFGDTNALLVILILCLFTCGLALLLLPFGFLPRYRSSTVRHHCNDCGLEWHPPSWWARQSTAERRFWLVFGLAAVLSVGAVLVWDALSGH